MLAQRYQVICWIAVVIAAVTRTPAAPMADDAIASECARADGYAARSQGGADGLDDDRAIIGLDIAIHRPEWLTGCLRCGTFRSFRVKGAVDKSPVFTAYISRAAGGTKFSPTPTQFKAFLDDISRMWASEPHFTAAELRGITVPTWIVDADHDEAIKRENTDYMASLIPGAGELILPGVSHFAFLQDPAMFNAALLRFLGRD